MHPMTEKMREQLAQLNGSIAQVAKAGRGLFTVVSEESKKQFSDLVKTGEAQQNQGLDILGQVKSAFPDALDVKTSAKTLSFAARGLLNKAKSESEKLFNELVTLGNTQVSPKATPRKTDRKAA